MIMHHHQNAEFVKFVFFCITVILCYFVLFLTISFLDETEEFTKFLVKSQENIIKKNIDSFPLINYFYDTLKSLKND